MSCERFKLLHRIQYYLFLHPYNNNFIARKILWFTTIFVWVGNVSCLLYLIFFLRNIVGDEDQPLKDLIIDKCQFLGVGFASFSSFWPTVVHRNKIGTIFKKSSNIEKTLLKHKMIPNYDLKFVKFLFLTISSLVLTEMFCESIQFEYFLSDRKVVLMSYFSEMTVIFCISEFVFIATMLSDNYKAIRESFCEENSRLSLSVYHKMARMIRDVNRIYTTLFLFLSFNTILATLLSSYFLVKTTLDQEYLDASFHLFWCVFRFLELWFVVYACEKLKFEIEKYNVYIITNVVKREIHIHEMDLFSIHFRKKVEVTFDACGLFKMDYTLLHSVIAGTATYLTLLWQLN